jgi:hypothetical protein
MTPTRFWVIFGAVVLVVTALLALLTVADAALWWPLWAGTLVSVALGTYFLTSFHHQRALHRLDPSVVRYWVVPLCLAGGGALFGRAFLGGQYGIAGALATAFGTIAVMYSQAALSDGLPTGNDAVRLISNLGVYIAGFLLFASIQSLELAAPVGTILLGVLGGLLASELFHDQQIPPARQVLYGALVSVVIAEVTFVAGFLPWGKVLTGLVLLLTFYLLSGLIHSHLHRRLTRWVAAEFVGVIVVALFLVYRFHGFGG